MKSKLKLFFAVAIFSVCAVTAILSLSPVVHAENKCGGVNTAIINCDLKEDDKKGGAIIEIIKIVIRIMAIGVGITAVGGIGYGAILYASAQDNAAQVQNARAIIRNVVIGIIAFSLMTVFLNFIIPGGVIG